jgi:hypothetical protein
MIAVSRDASAEANLSPGSVPLTRGSFALLTAIVVLAAAMISLLLRNSTALLSAVGVSGVTVPDAVSLTQTTTQFWMHPQEWPVDQLVTYLGVLVVYAPTVWLPSVEAALAINSILLWAAAQVFAMALDPHVGTCRARSLALVATAIVASNIYVLEVFTFANKELPLILLANLFVYWAVYRKNIILAIIPALTTYVFRDGFAAILLMTAFALLVRQLFGRLLSLALLGGWFALFLFLPSADLAGLDESIARNIRIGTAIAGDRFESWGTGISYTVRLVGNLLNLGLRPQFTDTSGGLYLLALGYWQSGVLIIAGVAGAVTQIVRRDANGAVSLLILLTLLGISYSAFVQPRYMMPLAFVLCASSARIGPWLWPVTLLCAVAPYFFAALGALPPLASG